MVEWGRCLGRVASHRRARTRRGVGAGMTGHATVIAGGGPTGMMLAAELTLGGVDVAVIERRASQDLAGSRSGGLHSRTIEVLDQRGVADRFLAEGHAVQSRPSPASHWTSAIFCRATESGLALWQDDSERILAAWVGELGVPSHTDCTVTGFTQDESGVDVELSDGRSLRAEYLVGCDGGRSVIRKTAGIEFSGWDPLASWLDRRGRDMDQEPEFGLRPGGGIGQREDGRNRIVLADPQLQHGEPALQDVRKALVLADGADYGVHSPTWISRFTDTTRQAESYHRGSGADRGRRRPRGIPPKEDKASTPACRMP